MTFSQHDQHAFSILIFLVTKKRLWIQNSLQSGATTCGPDLPFTRRRAKFLYTRKTLPLNCSINLTRRRKNTAPKSSRYRNASISCQRVVPFVKVLARSMTVETGRLITFVNHHIGYWHLRIKLELDRITFCFK